MLFGFVEPVEQHQPPAVGDADPLVRRGADPQRLADCERGLEQLRCARDVADIGAHDAPAVVQEHGIRRALPTELLQQIERAAVHVVRRLEPALRAQRRSELHARRDPVERCTRKQSLRLRERRLRGCDGHRNVLPRQLEIRFLLEAFDQRRRIGRASLQLGDRGVEQFSALSHASRVVMQSTELARGLPAELGVVSRDRASVGLLEQLPRLAILPDAREQHAELDELLDRRGIVDRAVLRRDRLLGAQQQLGSRERTPGGARVGEHEFREVARKLRARRLVLGEPSLLVRLDHLPDREAARSDQRNGHQARTRHRRPIPAHEFRGEVADRARPRRYRLVREIVAQVLREQLGGPIALFRIPAQRHRNDIVEIAPQAAPPLVTRGGVRQTRRIGLQRSLDPLRGRLRFVARQMKGACPRAARTARFRVRTRRSQW